MAADFPVEWDDPRDGDRTWELTTWTFPRPVPMLERDILVRFIGAMKRCHDESGFGFHQDSIRFVNGYAYAARSEEPSESVVARQQAYVESIRYRARQESEFYEDEIRPLLESRIKELGRAQRRATSLGAAVDVLEAAMEAAADAMGNIHWRMWDPTPFDWPTAFADITGRPVSEASVLLQGLGHDTARLVARLRLLARDVQRDAEFERGFAKLIRDHGRRTGFGAGSNATFHTPTWRMRPQLVRDIIASFARLDLDAVDAAERRAKAERVRLARVIRRVLKADPERLQHFEQAYLRARQRVLWGENSNRLIEQETIGLMREAISDVGTMLVGRGGLNYPDDVFHIALRELHEVARAEQFGGLRDLVVARRAELERLGEARAPRTIGRPPATPPPVSAPSTVVPHEGVDQSVLRGVGVAFGHVTGRARVVPASTDPPDIQPGDIVVARDAGPAWTPIFPLIGGLVLEAGALQDHAAIMARDLGIPTVMRVAGATSAIRDTSVVTVDGTAGTVSLAGVANT